MTNQEFIQAVAKAVQKYAGNYGIKVHSPIIAQAILESGWGKSKLASIYHNYFGLKCGSKWTGRSVNLTTKEEYTAGTLTTIKDNFRVFDSLEDGIKGYFDFIQLARYENLKGVTDPFEYIRLIKADGYATSSQYVDNLTKLVNQYNLTKYDRKGDTMGKTRKALVAQAQSWIGCKESNGTHKQIIDVYNTHKPLARGYKVQYTDAWCATFVSACAIKTGMTDIIPTECGCGAMINLMKKMGIWVENDAYVPSAGDIIMYDWDDTGAGDNLGNPDHVGIVEKCVDGVITVIEGNISNSVGRRTIRVNGRFIRGFGVPKYDTDGTEQTPDRPSDSGKQTVSKVTATKSAQKFDKSLGGAYRTTADLHIRNGAGTSNKSLTVIPQGTKVMNYGYYSIVNGTKWLYIQVTIKGVQYTGFSSANYLKKC